MKKFSFKSLMAGILVLAMAVTAMPVSGLQAKAEESETESVFILYDANRGEHYLTADASERDGLLAIGWTEGNVAWTAPKKSNTPVYVLYNPNNGGDHYYTSNASEKDGLLAQGWTEGNIKFYSDDNKGVLVNTLYNPNEVVRNHHYTTSKSERDGLVAIGWQDHTNAATAIYGVGKDLSANVTITDLNGLQADGTALPTDQLHLSYGAELGTPDTIIWYKDGAAADVYTSRGGFTGAFSLIPSVITGSEVQAAGKWYVIIQNTDGKNFTSNSITVSEVGLGKVSGVAAEDDYATANCGGLSFTATDDKVVLSATLNKDYNGIFYVYDATTTNYDKASAKAVLELTTGKIDRLTDYATGATGGKTGVLVVPKKAGMTTDAATKNATTYSGGAETAIKYVDPETGAVTYMFVPEASSASTTFATAGLVRGSSYKIVFDQEDVDSDDIGDVARKDVKASEAFTIPYLNAPKAIAVEDVIATAAGETANVQLYADEAMTEKLAWLGNQTTGITFTSGAADGITIKAYTNTKASTKDGKAMTAGAPNKMKLGKLSTFGDAVNATTLSCLYATATFDAGIWGAKKIELTSAIAGVPAQSVGKVATSYSKSAPNDIKVSFTGLKTEGTVFVVRTQRGGTNYTESNIEDDMKAAVGGDQSVIVGSAKVARGSESVTVKDCVPRIYSTGTTKADAYSAIFVPSNTSDFQIAATVVDDSGSDTNDDDDTYCIVTQLPTKYAIGGTAKKVGNVPDTTGADTTATLEVEDQFGNEISALSAALGGGSTPTGTTSFDGANGDSKTQNVKVGVTTNRKIYAVGTYAAGITAGDAYKYKIEDGAYICFTVVDPGTNAATAVWSISVTNE